MPSTATLSRLGSTVIVLMMSAATSTSRPRIRGRPKPRRTSTKKRSKWPKSCAPRTSAITPPTAMIATPTASKNQGDVLHRPFERHRSTGSMEVNAPNRTGLRQRSRCESGVEFVVVEHPDLAGDQPAERLDRAAHPRRIGDDAHALVRVEGLHPELGVVPHRLRVVAGELASQDVEQADLVVSGQAVLDRRFEDVVVVVVLPPRRWPGRRRRCRKDRRSAASS